MGEAGLTKLQGEEYLINLGKLLHNRAVQDTQRQANHLHVLAARRGGNVSGPRAHIKDDAALQPGDEKVRALVDDVLLDTGQPVKDDGARAALDVKERLRGGIGDNGRRHRQPVDGVEGSGSHLEE